MKVNFCLIASLLILTLVISSYVVLAQPHNSKEETIAEEMIHIRKIMKIGAPRSKSPPDRQWGERDSPPAAGPNTL
ncbi:hypothetical protein CARUB_v10016071mg [Capsella rubella]|uniref:Transmembrane protein n=1 Tax=Capsella rubella TaxID=81985 RepID=R0I449_9BRAS|nr:uncharacterized protein LOC17893816 [Capsella rubella]EOA32765.1 hypothetical protein CARUB_v10016071mg [Capsella rubella]